MTTQHTQGPWIVKKLILTLAFAMLIFAGCKESKPCDTEYTSRRWENLPASVRSDDVDYDLISEAIKIFNEAIGVEAFAIEEDSEKFVFVSYADLPDGTHGEGGVLVDENGFIDYSPVQIDVDLTDEEVVETLAHELGHALGLGGHQEYGIMHCYDNGADYDTDEEWYDAFELLREWFDEVYTE